MSELAKAVELPEQDPKVATVKALVRAQTGAIGKVLPQGTDPERFAQIVLTEVRRNPKLLQADGLSLLGAVMLGAQLRLEFGPQGHAYLLPFGKEVTFVIGYRGMIDLAMRSSKMASVMARAVFAGDEFDYQYGLSPNLVHKPMRDEPDDPDQLTHVYAIGRFTHGGQPEFVVLTRQDVEFYRDRSPSWKAKKKNPRITTPWDTDYVAMAKKTAVRRLFPFLATSVEDQQYAMIDERRVPAGTPLVESMMDETKALDVPADDEAEAEVVDEGADTEPEVEEPVDADEEWE